MNYKIYNNYFDRMKKIIDSEIVFNEIVNNINFVEKYIDKIDAKFCEKDECFIVYKQLGMMTFSCVEALLKSCIKHFQIKCNEQNCDKNINCKYYKNDNQLKNLSISICFEHLNNMRVVSVLPFEKDAIDKLYNMRNYTHISKFLENEKTELKFDKAFVESILKIFYVFLNQIEYFPFDLNKCISDLDGNCYEENKVHNDNEKKYHHSQQVYYAMTNLLNKRLTEKDEEYLKKIKQKNYYNEKEIVALMGKELYFNQRYYKTDEQFQNAKNDFLNVITTYNNEKDELSNKINNEYTKIKRLFSE